MAADAGTGSVQTGVDTGRPGCGLEGQQPSGRANSWLQGTVTVVVYIMRHGLACCGRPQGCHHARVTQGANNKAQRPTSWVLRIVSVVDGYTARGWPIAGGNTVHRTASAATVQGAGELYQADIRIDTTQGEACPQCMSAKEVQHSHHHGHWTSPKPTPAHVMFVPGDATTLHPIPQLHYSPVPPVCTPPA